MICFLPNLSEIGLQNQKNAPKFVSFARIDALLHRPKQEAPSNL